MTLKFVGGQHAPPYVNVLLYGPPKSGKTAGACSMPGGVMLLNADLPNAAWYARSLAPDGRIQELQYQGLDMLAEIVHAFSQPQDVFQTIVVDTVGELYRRLLDEVSDDALRKTLPQYGDAGTYVERLCRALCESPVNVVFVCHEAPVKNEATGEFESLPLTGTSNPALGQKLMGMVDVIGWTHRFEQEEKVEYVAQVVTADGRRGGDRFDCLDEGQGYRRLDLGDWMAAIREKTAPPQAPAGKAAPAKPARSRRKKTTDKPEEKAA